MTTQASPSEAPRIAALDGLRGISIIIVLLSHSPFQLFSDLGGLGVMIFFALSGFLITNLLITEHQKTGTISLVDFYKRRTLRLAPALYLTIVLFLIAALCLLKPIEPKLHEAFAALTYVTNWTRALDIGHSQYLGHLWSLGIEEQFYIIWPAILTLALTRSARLALVIAVLGAAAAALWRTDLTLHGASVQRLYNGFDTRTDSVLLGCVAAFVPRLAARLWIVGLLVLMGLAAGTMMGQNPPLTSSYTIAPAAAALVIAGAASGGWAAKMFSVPPLTALGRISYGLYLFHFPIFLILHGAARLEGIVLFLTGLFATLALATLSYLFIEKRVLRLRNASMPEFTNWAIAALGPASILIGIGYLALLSDQA